MRALPVEQENLVLACGAQVLTRAHPLDSTALHRNFGVYPITAVHLLQKCVAFGKQYLNDVDVSLGYILLALFILRRHPKEDELKNMFGNASRIRQMAWLYIHMLYLCLPDVSYI